MTQDLTPDLTAEGILHFWFEECTPKQWFEKDAAFDAQIRARFGDFTEAQIAQYQQKKSHPWQDQADSALALIILADQFPRNMYRDKPQSFGWGDIGLALANEMLTRGQDKQLPEGRRMFAYLPFMHSEDLADQQTCVDLMAGNEHAQAHYDLIKNFGRFPHRNAILGRKSTPQEVKFLAEGGYQP